MRDLLSRRDVLRLAPVLAFTLGLAGCGGSSPTTPAGSSGGDQATITSVLVSNPTFLDDGLMNADVPTQASRARPAGGDAAIAPLTFWRSVTGSELDLAFTFSDSNAAGRPQQADVVFTRHFTGTFHVLPGTGEPGIPDTGNVVQKPLADTWVRHLRLRRLPVGDGGQTAWHLVEASLAEVTSSQATSNITSLRVQGPEVDTTLTDPSALWTLPRVRSFAPGAIVTVTATTAHADDVVLAYWHERRALFQNKGDGTHTFDLHIGSDDSGWRWFGVNSLTRGTLHDDEAPYDSKAWIFGCWVGPRPERDHY